MKKNVILSVVMLIACFVQLMGQDRQVSGTVICSTDSLPLFMVSICAEGTTLGAISRENGEFSLNVPDCCSSLIFSYIGMKTRCIKFSEQNEVHLNVYMEPDALELAAVTIVYDTLAYTSRSYLTEFQKDTVLKMNALVKADVLQADDLVRDLK